MNGELLTLLVGAIVGGFVTYLFTMREKSITREFELYQKGMSYLQSIYGFISVSYDLVDGYVRATEMGKAQVSDIEGFVSLTPDEILHKFNKRYEEFTKYMGNAKKDGSEVFLRKDLAKDVTDFWILASYLYEKGNWDEYLASKLDRIAVTSMDRIENLLGIRRRFLKKPKWLKPSELRSILKGEESV